MKENQKKQEKIMNNIIPLVRGAGIGFFLSYGLGIGIDEPVKFALLAITLLAIVSIGDIMRDGK